MNNEKNDPAFVYIALSLMITLILLLSIGLLTKHCLETKNQKEKDKIELELEQDYLKNNNKKKSIYGYQSRQK